MIYENMIRYLKDNYPYLEAIPLTKKHICFEERVKLLCVYCAKYDTNWRCPGKLPKNIDYNKVFEEYQNLSLVYVKIPLTKDNFEDVRRESSTMLHKALLMAEKYLYENDQSLGLSFIGGSCKLCKNGCDDNKCRNPYQSRTPLEALGVNVVETAKNVGLPVVFPPKDYMLRIGLLLW